MKTISELKKSATVLDRKQLKNLLGGAGCAAGETKYHCTITDEGGSYSGAICSTSARSAARTLRSVMPADMEYSAICG